MPAKRAVYFVADDRFAQLALAAARRVRALAQQNFDCFVFLDSETRYQDPSIQVVYFRSSDLIPSLPSTSNRVPLVAFARYFVVGAFLRDYDRVLYLDADIAVNGPVEPVFDLMGDQDVLCAVPSFRRLVKDRKWREYAERISVNPDRYFNSGVLLINVRRFLALPLARTLTTFYSRHGEYLDTRDQDFANYVIGDNWRDLPPEWNFQGSAIKRNILAEIKPVIAHYSGAVKPWHANFHGDQRHRAYFKSIGVPFEEKRLASFSRWWRKARRLILGPIRPKYREEQREMAERGDLIGRAVRRYYGLPARHSS